MSNRYFSLALNNREATLNIYGEITSWDYSEKDVSSFTLSKQLENIDADTIHVYINSYGGDVNEGLAIYNNLKRSKAKIITYADGFACSIASVIFMAGDERIVSNASLMLIHNAWTYTQGNAKELRKKADDLDVITQASINTYMTEVNISEEELKELLDNETWLTPQQALEWGFATSMVNAKVSDGASQSVRRSIFDLIYNQKSTKKKESDKEVEETKDEEEKDIEEEKGKNKKEDKGKEASNTKQMFEVFINAIANSK